MSSYKMQTKHPIDGLWYEASWIDNYFGHHKYGVEFPDGNVFDPRFHKMETKEFPPFKRMSNNKVKFLIAYAKVPYNTRKEVVCVLDNKPLSWNVVFLEVDNGTPMSKIILKKLKKLGII
jgi:hypothetical protein